MKYIVLIILCLTLISCVRHPSNKKTNTSLSSSKSIEGTNLIEFRIEGLKDTISFVQLSKDTLLLKPAIVFLQGSLPIPIIIDLNGTRKHVNIPFNFDSLSQSFHVFEIAMPYTPIEASLEHLNERFCYIPDSNNPTLLDTNYLKSNELDTYVDRTQKVVQVISKFNWVDNESIHIIGHSQGAKVACVVASDNDLIKSVSLLGFNAFGRFDQYLRQNRADFAAGKTDSVGYLNAVKSAYARYKEIHENPNDFYQENNSWVSFSIDYSKYLKSIKAPTFIGYGTEDIIAENCDLIPLKFIEAGKSNYRIQPYLGMDHSFFEMENGRPNRQKGHHFDEVIQDIVTWIDEGFE